MAALINCPKIRPISSHTETGNANLIVQKINALFKNAIKKKNIKPAMENFRTKVKLDERKVTEVTVWRVDQIAEEKVWLQKIKIWLIYNFFCQKIDYNNPEDHWYNSFIFDITGFK